MEAKTKTPVKKSKKIKCSFCKKKLGLVSFSCKCVGIFCVKHQTAHSHKCPHTRTNNIQKNNPKIQPIKVEAM